MKIIYDNIIYSIQLFGGISVVWTNLLSRMLKKEDDICMLEYEGAESNISRCEVKFPSSMITKMASSFMKVRRYFNPSFVVNSNGENFIFHSSYNRVLHHPNAVNITTVHDFTYDFYMSGLTKYVHCRQLHKAIRQSDHVVCISENTRRDLFKLFPDISKSKVSVIYNGVDHRFSRIKNAETKDYVLYVGKRATYKNFESIIEPLARCKRPIKIVGPKLTENEVHQMVSYGLEYEYCGMVSDEELNRLYCEAFCLIYPSLYEGFGLPVIEAQMAGCPAIACNCSSIPEVISDKRMLLDDVSYDSLSNALKLLEDKQTRLEIVENGLAVAQRFSWDTMAEQYHTLYEKCLEQKK